MTTISKYLVNLVNGRVVVTPSDCTEADEDTAALVRRLLTTHERRRNFKNGATVLDSEIDPLIRDLDQIRKAKGLTIEALAKAAFMEPNRVGEYLHGKVSPTLATVRTLCTVLGVSARAVSHPALIPEQRQGSTTSWST